MAMVCAVAATSVGEGVAVVERHRAAAAADAAALSAALHAVDGPTAACAVATRLARENDAAVTRCTVVGAIAEVVVAVGLPGPLAAFGAAVGRARAGPTTVSPTG